MTALDAGFATAMSIRWKWLRDIASLAFSGYYLLFANEADEKVSQPHSGHSSAFPPAIRWAGGRAVGDSHG